MIEPCVRSLRHAEQLVLHAQLFDEGGHVYMPLSGKAQEIHDHIVNAGAANQWVGTAKGYITRKGQYEPGPPYKVNRGGLREKLKSDLSGAVNGATDSHWEEIADWLLETAHPK